MTDVSLKDRAIQLLQDLVRDRDGHIGICGELNSGMGKFLPSPDWDVFELDNNIFETWEHFSGNLVYPIADPSLSLGPDRVYHLTDHHWKGAYGKLRINLTNFVIEGLQADVFTIVKSYDEDETCAHYILCLATDVEEVKGWYESEEDADWEDEEEEEE